MPQTIDVLTTQLLALNNSENPFTVTVDGTTVVAAWNIVDANWYQLFAKAGMKKTYEMQIKLYPDVSEFSYTDRELSLTWEGGVPRIDTAANMFQGKEVSFEMGARYGIKSDGSVGEIYNFDFSTSRIKKPILEIFEKCGWKAKPSFLGSMLGMK